MDLLNYIWRIKMVQDSEEKLMKIKNTPENRDKCHCKVCPSYPYKCGGEFLYCSKGPSKCDIDPEVCICNTCPLYFEYELQGNYFCDKDIVGESRSLIRKKRMEKMIQPIKALLILKIQVQWVRVSSDPWDHKKNYH